MLLPACGKASSPNGGQQLPPVLPPTGPSGTPMIALEGSLSFGNVAVGSSKTLTVFIHNTGTGTLTVNAVVAPDRFTLGVVPQPVAAGASLPVGVTFSPNAATTYSGTLVVYSDAANGSPTTMPITGTGSGSNPPPPPSQCTYTLSVGSMINGYPSGGSFPVTVSAPNGCSWTASSADPWLHVSGSSTGTGNVTIIEDANNTASARVGTVTIAGQTVTFNQTTSVAPVTTITLTYTGRDFTSVTGTYKTTDKVTGTVVLKTPLPPNVTTCNLSSSLLSWTFSDGHQTISSSNSGAFSESCFGTNASGSITSWNWNVTKGAASIQAADFEDFVMDAAGSTGQSNKPGQWTVSSSPSSFGVR